MLDNHYYDLSFDGGSKKPKTPPAIIFTINAAYLPQAVTLFSRYCERNHVVISSYLRDLDTTFTLPVPDLFGYTEFGFGKCGLVVIDDSDAHLRIELGPGEQIYYCALTISVLVLALTMIETAGSGNRKQQVELSTRADRSVASWGHILNGYISTSVMQWLGQYAQANTVYDSYWSTPMPPKVIDAMKVAWRVMSGKEMKRWAQDADGAISNEGHFILKCFGNACDFSIYPDSPVYRDEGYAQLGCHNIDSADQQLALLAGFAKICELARS